MLHLVQSMVRGAAKETQPVIDDNDMLLQFQEVTNIGRKPVQGAGIGFGVS
jgi:hypothetical protein